MSLSINFNNLASDADWAGALAKIIIFMAGETKASQADMDELQEVLNEYQERIPNLALFEPLRDIASDLATVVMINIIDSSLADINERNTELKTLAEQLGEQVKSINNSANLLQNIKAQIEQATQFIKNAKQIAEAATNPDASKIEKLKAIITALVGLKDVFS